MSIRDRLRSSSSVLTPLDTSKENAGSSDDASIVTGVALSCEDVTGEGDVHRDYKLIRGVHRTVDFVRASSVNPSGRISIAAGGASRATFSSPVMSRRHARITFAEDGSVTVMDIGSMHGTFLNCVDFEEFEPERLKPRRHYTLRSGDTLLLGKAINRDDKDWKPVVIRVTLVHHGELFATSPSNRYGLYLASVDASEPDENEDAYSVSSSSDGEHDDGRSQSGTSPEASPVVSHGPMPLGVSMSISASASASHESLVSASRSADELNSASGVFDLNRTISARSALRAILPPIPRIQSAIRRLPSLRELGFFTGSDARPADVNEGKVVNNQDGEAPNPAYDVDAGEPDTNVLAPIKVDSIIPSQDAEPSVAQSQPTSVENDSKGSMFAWQEASHPQNQLGLELNEQGELYMEQVEENNQNAGQESAVLPDADYMQADVDNHVEQGEEMKEAHDQDDVKSMDISPGSSRAGTPTPASAFRASVLFDVDPPMNAEPSQPAESEEQHCRCHEQEEHQSQDMNQDQQQVHPQEDVPIAPEPITPQSKRTPYTLTPASAAELDTERRRTKAARFAVAYDPIPSPVSIGKERRKRVGTRVGPTRKSPPPNPPGPFGRVKVVSKYAPDVDILRARVRSLETRMQEIQGSAIMMASVASASASTSASAASVDEARKEMESLREEMRRLSRLMESLIAKIEAQAIEPMHTDNGVQVSSSQSETPFQASRKRKRTDDVYTVSPEDLVTEKLARGLNGQIRQPSSTPERIQSFHESIEDADVRAAKRARVGADRHGRRAVMTVAAAAGYTSLGAALAWVMLAYVL